MSRKFSIALTSENHDFLLALSPTLENGFKEVRYRPNTLALNGIQVTAYGLTLAYKSAVSRNPDEDSKKGKTSYEDIRAALSLGAKDQWLLVGYYNRYGGLYIENSSDVDPTYATRFDFIQRSDFSVFNSGAAVVYVWSPDQFSLAAAVFQSARQTKSGGSFLAMAALDGSLYEATDPVIPTLVQSYFGEDAQLTSGKFTTASLIGGYGYTLTGSSFFLTLLALIGPGYQWRQYSVAGEERTSTRNASKLIYGGTAGYNGERFFAGVSYLNNSTDYHTESIRFRANLFSFRMFVGVRF